MISTKRKQPKNPTPINLLSIGDIVSVKARVCFDREQDIDENFVRHGPIKRVMNRYEIEPKEMIVVGARRRKLGIVHLGRHYTDDGDEYDPGYLEETESVFVYQVRIGLMRKIVEVLPQDVSKM